MQINKNLRLKLILYFFIFIVLVSSAFYFLLHARVSQKEFKNIRTAQKIDETMLISYVSKKFSIPEQEILSELKMSINHWNSRYTIGQACKKNKLDCPAVVDNLNKKISK